MFNNIKEGNLQTDKLKPGTPIGDEFLPSNAYADQGAIQLPPYEGNYEINPRLFDWVREKPFKGEPEENPCHHIQDLMDLFETFQTHPAVMEIIKCKVFAHSLDGKALRWLQCLPHASLKSWDEVRDAFLDHFFTKSMTIAFRSKISNFRQEKGEEFHKAWFRYLGYTVDCPHHGFSKAEVITSFYNGLEMEQQMFLNLASNGDFSTKDSDAARRIIENFDRISRDRADALLWQNAMTPRSGKQPQESEESISPRAQNDECRSTEPSFVDRHQSQTSPEEDEASDGTVDEEEPEEDEWSEDESCEDESSDGEIDEEKFKELLRGAYMEYYGTSPESAIHVMDSDDTLIQTGTRLKDMLHPLCHEFSNKRTLNDDPVVITSEIPSSNNGDVAHHPEPVIELSLDNARDELSIGAKENGDEGLSNENLNKSSSVSIDRHNIVDRHPSELYALQPETLVKQGENDVFTDEELHCLILEGIEEEKKVRKMEAQPFTEVAKEIPLPDSIGMYDKLIEDLKSDMLCSEESSVETPEFIKDIHNLMDSTKEAASLRAENLSTRFDEIKSGMNNLHYIIEDRISTFEQSACLSREIYLENDLNVDKVLEEVDNSKIEIESETENTLFYEVKGDKVDYAIDPPKPEIDFIFSPDAFYSHMHQPHLERFMIELENVASAYYNCMLAICWNLLCLVVCLFACTDRRRTKGGLAQPFDSCD